MQQRLPPWLREWWGLVEWRLLLRRMAFVLPTAVIIACIIGTFLQDYAVGWTAVAAIGTLSVATIALLRDWLLTVLFPLRLRLELDRSLLSYPAEGPTLDQMEHAAWWLGLRVHSTPRWRAAKRCRVMLVEMHTILPDGQRDRRGMTIPCPLLWGVLDQERQVQTIDLGEGRSVTLGTQMLQVTVGAEPEVVNLLRLGPVGQGQAIRMRDRELHDALSSANPPPALYLTLARWTFNFRTTIRPGETVRVALQVRADDVIPHGHFVYQISWDGEWPESQAEFWEHVDVKPMSES